MNNFKIGSRLTFGFGIILLIMVGLGSYSLIQINTLRDHVVKIVKVRMVKIEMTGKIGDNINIVARSIRNIYIDEDKDHQKYEMSRIVSSRENISDILGQLLESARTFDGKSVINETINLSKIYDTDVNSFIKLVEEGNHEQAKIMLFERIRNSQKSYLTSADKLTAYYTEFANETGKIATDSAKISQIGISAAIIMAIIFGVIISILIVKSITIPIGKSVILAETMANGDFTTELDIHQTDEIGILADALNSTVKQLNTMMVDVISYTNQLSGSSISLARTSEETASMTSKTADQSNSVAAAVEEMSTNVQSISIAMEQSTSNINMVATATEEMTATITEIASNAENARTISQEAVDQAKTASVKISLLQESAEKINKVTEAITEISSQTNLLALNATIEAARAGESGKGFAVVANEIKILSKQTADATVDIKRQIEDIQKTTSATVLDIQNISDIIIEVNRVINEIANAVEEQSTASNEIASSIANVSQGASEVNDNVSQSTVVISDVSKEIANINQQINNVENNIGEVQTSASDLSELAVQLKNIMSKFTV